MFLLNTPAENAVRGFSKGRTYTLFAELETLRIFNSNHSYIVIYVPLTKNIFIPIFLSGAWWGKTPSNAPGLFVPCGF